MTLAPHDPVAGSLRASLRRDVIPRYVLDVALQLIPDAALVVDDGGVIVAVNSVVETTFGYRTDEVVDEYIEFLVPGRSLLSRNAASVGAARRRESTGRRRDGSLFPVEMNVSTIETESGTYSLITVRDITERRQIEDLKTEFLENAAHELRTPLTAVFGLVSVLTSHRHGMSEEQVGDALLELDRQGKRARRLVTNLLDLAQIQHGTLHLDVEPARLRDAFGWAVDANPPPPGIDLAVSIPDDAVVITDLRRLQQVMANLLTNAYRFGATHIVVQGAVAGRQVIARVTDDGNGVPPELAPKLFEPFSRGSVKRDPDGSGLGLAMARMLLEALGSEIWYEPVHPRGARFVMRLPLAR